MMSIATLCDLFLVAAGHDKPDCLLHKVDGAQAKKPAPKKRPTRSKTKSAPARKRKPAARKRPARKSPKPRR